MEQLPEDPILDFYTGSSEEDRLYAGDIPIIGKIFIMLWDAMIILLLPFIGLGLCAMSLFVYKERPKETRKDDVAWMIFEFVPDFINSLFWYSVDGITFCKSEKIRQKATDAIIKHHKDMYKLYSF